MLLAEKLAVASRLTMVFPEEVLVELSLNVTAPATVLAVMFASPVTDRTPALLNVVELPKGTGPPPLRPLPGLTVIELLANWVLLTVPLNWLAGKLPVSWLVEIVPVNCSVGTVPVRLLALFAKIAYGVGVSA